MTAADRALMLALLVLIGVLYAQHWGTPSTATAVAISSPEGRVVHALKPDRELAVRGRLGTSHIHIQDGAVRFVDSPCRHKICQRSGWHRLSGAVAACVPNRISLVLQGGQEDTLDAVSY